MKRLVLAVLTCALILPTQAAASLDALPAETPGSATTAANAILENPADLTAASLFEFAHGGSGAPSPLGLGDNTPATDPPHALVGFPTFGNTYAVLSSGEINSIASITTNTQPGTSFSFPLQTVPLTPPIPNRGPEAEDWTVLKIDVNVPAGANCLSLDYRFLSEEFPEFVNKGFNDAFIAELDTTSWAVPTGNAITRPNDFAASPAGQPISVNGVGPTAVFASEANGTYFDAATGLITTKTPITPGAHSIFLSIFDANDQIYDSAVFVDDLRFITESATTCQPPKGVAPPKGPPPPPSNKFTPGSSVQFGNAGTSATLTVEVPGPGTLTAGSTTIGAAAARAARVEAVATAKKKAKGKKCKPKGKKKCKKKPKKKVKKPLLKPSTVIATQAGPVQITITLTKTGAAILKKRGKLTIPVTLTFTPTGGTPASQIRSVTFKAPKKKCGKGKVKKGKKCVKKKAKGKGKKY